MASLRRALLPSTYEQGCCRPNGLQGDESGCTSSHHPCLHTSTYPSLVSKPWPNDYRGLLAYLGLTLVES